MKALLTLFLAILTMSAKGLSGIEGNVTQLRLTPEKATFVWDDWDITIEYLQFSEMGSASSTPMVVFSMTAVNRAHKSRAFSPLARLKLIIGQDEFDAVKDLGDGELDVQPTMESKQACCFIVPRASLSESFKILFKGGWADFSLPVAIIRPVAVAPIPIAMPTPTEAELAAAKEYWANERTQEEAEAKRRFAQREAVCESRGDFSQAPGLTAQEKMAKAIKWAEEDAKKLIIGATPAPQ
jgi:hypothetical protein